MKVNNIIPLNIPANQIMQHRIDSLRKHCAHSFRVPPEYHSALSEYVLTYWSVEYLIHRLEKNALEIERNGRIYNIIFDKTNITRLLALAHEYPLHQVRLSFRRALPQYEIDNYVLIQTLLQPARAIAQNTI